MAALKASSSSVPLAIDMSPVLGSNWTQPIEPVEKIVPMGRDLNAFRNEQQFTDYSLSISSPEHNEKAFPVHRLVLASASEYFRGLLLSGIRSDGESSCAARVSLSSDELEVFPDALRYMY